MINKRYIFPVLALLLAVTHVNGQTKLPATTFHELNYTGNMMSAGSNPASISFNPETDQVNINLYSALSRGDFRPADGTSRSNEFGINIEGFYRFGKVDYSGRINYSNDRSFNKRFNSTLFLSEYNPFILGDGVKSDFDTETFDLMATVSYRPVSNFIAALELNYLTGSTANQSNPRPKTNSIRFHIKPGVQILGGEKFSGGVFGKFELMNQDITHNSVYTLENYIIYRFFGLGNQSPQSTGGGNSTYPRNYKGRYYSGGFNLNASNAYNVFNHFELTYDFESEKARDGGRMYTFRGGDYRGAGINIYNRLQFAGERNYHNISVRFKYFTTSNKWYQQTLYNDQNGNSAYRVEYAYIIDQADHTDLSVLYEYDRYRSGKPNWGATAGFSYTDHSEDQNEHNRYYQKYEKITVNAGVKKNFNIRKSILGLSVRGLYATPLSSSMKVHQDLAAVYTAPMFEYRTGSYAGVDAGVDLNIPVNFSGFGTWLGVFAEVNSRFYTGDSEYSDKLKDTKYNIITFGVNISF